MQEKDALASHDVEVATAVAPAAHAPDPERFPVGRFYRPELDALRFAAFLLVFLSHSFENVRWINNAGGYGVDLFFALSSYLITTLLLKEHRATGEIDARKFYIRRGLRIWPLYFFFLLIVVPVAHFTIHDHLNRYYLSAFLVGGGNWACAAWGWPLSIAAPLWSISIEEQFYLAWPFVMKRFLRRLPEIAIGLLAVSTITRIILATHGASHTAVWCNTFARLDPIAGGALLACFLYDKMPSFSSGQRCALIAFGVAALFCAGVFGDSSGPKFIWTCPLVSAACVAMLIAVLGIAHTMPQPLIYLGKISYGLYVYHVLALWLVHESPIPALVLTILVSALSYRCLEVSFLRLKERFALVGSRPT